MNNTIQILKSNIGLIAAVMVIGIFLGWLIFDDGEKTTTPPTETDLHEGHDHNEEPATWTCSMHPQIKQNKPGLCPICNMDLIPLSTMHTEGDDVDPNEISMSESAAKLADIQTVKISTGTPEKLIHLQGKIQEDERRISEITARFGGRIEELFVNFTGQNVRKGEKLATIYSPDLVTAQRELIEAAAFKETRPALYNAAVGKLRLWDLTEEQISSIEANSDPIHYFDVLSPISGTVIMRHVAIGDYVKEGKALFKVINLSRVWALFDAYESDLPWIRMNDNVEFTIPSLPGKAYSGKVSFIDPFIDPVTRVAKIRIDVNNPSLEIKPEMFTSGTINSVVAESSDKLLVPKSAILWTGKRAVVYTKVQERENPSFLYREIVLGPETGNHYVVAEGLEAGEEIAVNGVFKIDAAAQLQGLPSMMNPDGGMVSHGHDHGAASGTTDSELHVSFKVAGNCSMCKDRIEKAAVSVAGVLSANWNIETKELHLNYRKGTDQDLIHNAIANAGHDTEKVKAPDEVYNELHECCLYERLEYSGQEKKNRKHEMVKVSGNCEMCKERIEKAAHSVKGVQTAEWSSETEMLHMEFDASITNSDEIQKAIAAVGHDTEKHIAPNFVYNELPGCCLYRDE